ncbi:hypothetical protein [Streptomyces avidinii]|uniref:Secreted protein n=1 Tax=Streptomyces avidinii TaxID=1895 RepID=A0ABS4LDK6_STRAV|nr:hypothetical protein [Streptomyces avidinii]MBP2040206.1 hypothetical protein [Streptomyces avidinii]GGZ27419.1 hypothetical protein GCM10010343_63510 [Streptomyces avidinii]
MSEQQNVTGAEAEVRVEDEATVEAATETGTGTEAAGDVATLPEPEQPAAAGPAPKVNRKVVTLVAAAVGAVVLVGAGVGAAAALAGADRTSPTRYWLAADHTTSGTQAPVPSVPPNALTGKLLPMPNDYWPGPDIDKEGNFYSLSGERALESFKDARKGLSSSERTERDKVLADLKLKGLAGRSYSRKDGVGGGVVAEIQLVQADPAQLAKFGEFAGKLIALGGSAGEAPKVDGHPQAKCSVNPIVIEKKDKKNKIDALDCLAVEGDVMVSFRMYGSEGFVVKDAAGLFKQQLDHLKSPGESA